MQNLPPGWRVSNSSGSWSAPAINNDGPAEDDDGAAMLENEDLRPDSPGWEDMEDDTEVQNIKCLLCDSVFGNTEPMLEHCRTEHKFDLDEIRKRHSTMTRLRHQDLEADHGFQMLTSMPRSSW